MKTQIVSCDVENCHSTDNVKNHSLSILFTTEQTEGTFVAIHLSTEDVDLCQKCLDKVLEGNFLYGSGCQGYNKYWFKL